MVIEGNLVETIKRFIAKKEFLDKHFERNKHHNKCFGSE